MIVAFRCLCGKLHTLLRKDVLEGLGLSNWKCAGCKRRFIIACAPAIDGGAEEFWPIYLEETATTGSTREDGLPSELERMPSTPSEVPFQCRCNCRLIARSASFGRPLRCPKCGSNIVLQAGFQQDTGRPIALPLYPDDVDGKPIGT